MDETRHARLESRILHELSTLLMRGEIKDHRVDTLVSFSYIRLAKDAATARVGVSTVLGNQRHVERAVEDIRSAMEGMLAPDLKEQTIGSAEVRDTFKVPKIGLVAGCYVTSGEVRRSAKVHLVRNGIEIYTGSMVSLKRFKDDAKEVVSGLECGLNISNFNDIKVGDIVEAYEETEVRKTL